jgi:hypothetical protein
MVTPVVMVESVRRAAPFSFHHAWLAVTLSA